MVDNLAVKETPSNEPIEEYYENEDCRECEDTYYECCTDYCYQCGHCGCCSPEEHNFICSGGCDWCECEDCMADCDCEECLSETEDQVEVCEACRKEEWINSFSGIGGRSHIGAMKETIVGSVDLSKFVPASRHFLG